MQSDTAENSTFPVKGNIFYSLPCIYACQLLGFQAETARCDLEPVTYS